MSKPRNFNRRSASKDLADWTRLLAKQNTFPEGVTGPTVKVKLGVWNVNLIGVADEAETGVIVDCPADLLTLHAELVTLFGIVQKKFGALIEKRQKNRNSIQREV